MDDFERLLRKRELIENTPIEREVIPLSPKSLPQKADRSASLFDFIKMVDKIVSLTMKDVKFIPEEGKVLELDAMKKIEQPIITYKVLTREPKDELKPRRREEIIENRQPDENGVGEVWGQKFKCNVQFNIFASVYNRAEEVMEKFEELIMTYTGFFKQNGVAEILFKQQYTDETYSNLRETLSVRNLCYYVEIEKLTVIFKEKIKEIEILTQKEEI